MKKAVANYGEQLLLFSPTSLTEDELVQSSVKTQEAVLEQLDKPVNEPPKQRDLKPQNTGSARVE